MRTINIGMACDGWEISIFEESDSESPKEIKSFYWNHHDNHEILKDLCEFLDPNAEVIIEEVY